MPLSRWIALASFGILAALAGCSDSGIHPVRGEFVYPDGTPAKELKGSRVVFEGTGPDGKNYSSDAEIDDDGKFELTTTKPGDGAPLGKNRVLVERRFLDPERPAPRVIDERYEHFETSGLEFEVTTGSNDAKFTVAKATSKK